jgi:OHCU decarboxylase
LPATGAITTRLKAGTEAAMRPTEMDKATFMATFGAIYEHSPWVPNKVWETGLEANHDTAEGLNTAFGEVIRSSGPGQQLALLRAHPPLATGIASQDDLTRASRREQSGAGLDQCSAPEYAEFQRLNASYEERFEFPFIMAVKGFDRHQILAAFRSRLANPAEVEFLTAVEQVIRIGSFRLEEAFQRLQANDD